MIFVATDISQKLRSALELAVVAATVMLLVALALRSYETTIVRGQLAEAFFLTSTVRADMMVYRAQHGHWPENEAELHSSTLSQEENIGTYADHMTLHESGALSTIFGGEDTVLQLHGRQLTMRPLVVPGHPGSPVSSACAAFRPPDGLVASGPDNTNIETTHLPASCRDY